MINESEKLLSQVIACCHLTLVTADTSVPVVLTLTLTHWSRLWSTQSVVSVLTSVTGGSGYPVSVTVMMSTGETYQHSPLLSSSCLMASTTLCTMSILQPGDNIYENMSKLITSFISCSDTCFPWLYCFSDLQFQRFGNLQTVNPQIKV